MAVKKREQNLSRISHIHGGCGRRSIHSENDLDFGLFSSINGRRCHGTGRSTPSFDTKNEVLVAVNLGLDQNAGRNLSTIDIDDNCGTICLRLAAHALNCNH